MAAYTGRRFVLPEQNVNDLVNPYKEGAPKYSYWVNYTQTQLLEDAPLEDHTPGEGRHPGDYAMSRWFTGKDDASQPLNDPQHPEIAEAGRSFKPWEYKGLDEIFHDDYGHADDEEGPYATWSNWKFSGLDELQALDDPGANKVTAATFGAFHPWEHESRAVSDGVLKDGGMDIPEGYDHPYGRNRVNEWRGVVRAL